MKIQSHRLSVAPMMECTDRHERYFLRLVSRRVRLYTEMITTGAILYGDRERHLRFDPREHPVAVQLGGSDPAALAECAAIAAERGYDEINLNVGCPSGRVQSGRFGACLMADPALVARCVGAMAAAVSVPVTVKSRIGIDDRDSYQDLERFVLTVAEGGCRVFVVHARRAVLGGLSPKQNREVPPLRYPPVYRLKERNPDLTVVINGGIGTIEDAAVHLAHVDGAMIGRAAYADPYMLAAADRRIFGEDREPPTREAVLEAFVPYAARAVAEGAPLASVVRHLSGLFNGVPGARAWRRHLAEAARRPGAGSEILSDGAALVAAAAERFLRSAA